MAKALLGVIAGLNPRLFAAVIFEEKAKCPCFVFIEFLKIDFIIKLRIEVVVILSTIV